MALSVWAFKSFTLPFIMTGGDLPRATGILGVFIYKRMVVDDGGVSSADKLPP